MAARNAIIPRLCLKCGQTFVGKAYVLKQHGREERAKAHNERIVKEIAERKARMDKAGPVPRPIA